MRETAESLEGHGGRRQPRSAALRRPGSSDGGGGAAVREMRDLQSRAGNAAATRVVAQRATAQQEAVVQDAVVQRMAGSSAAGPSGVQEHLDTTEADRELLRAYAAETQNPEVRRLLDELLPLLDRVAITDTQGTRGGGHTVRAGDGGYQVTFASRDRRDRIATLVHELTHVAVQEAYDADMLNFPVPALSDEDRARVERETPGREEDIQNARLGLVSKDRRTEYIDHVLNSVQQLVAALPTSGLDPDTRTMLREKLTNHMGARPYHEYDGVLSHALALCDTYGADTSSEFYRLLSRLVEQAAGWRSAGAVDLPATEAASAPEAAAGDSRRRNRVRLLAQKVLAVLRKLRPRRS